MPKTTLNIYEYERLNNIMQYKLKNLWTDAMTEGKGYKSIAGDEKLKKQLHIGGR